MQESAFRGEVLAHVERSLTNTRTVEDYFRVILDRAGELIGVDGSYSISTLLYGQLTNVASTDRAAWEADQMEFDTEAGPCVEALRHRAENVIEDLSVEQRWPAWREVAAARGFRCAAGLPGQAGPDAHPIAINLYGRSVGAFAGEPLQRGRILIEEVGRTLPMALRILDQSRVIADLQSAMASRSTIDQALGVLMAQNRCSRDEAFAVLRRSSQNGNVKLRDLAATIIERYTQHPAAAPPDFDAARRFPA